MASRTLQIHHGKPENTIVIVPPLTEAELGSVFESGLITTDMVGSTQAGESATVVHFGRLILGITEMDTATTALAHDLKRHLEATTQELRV